VLTANLGALHIVECRTHLLRMRKLQVTTLALRGPGWLAPLLRGRRNDGLVIIFNRTEVELKSGGI